MIEWLIRGNAILLFNINEGKMNKIEKAIEMLSSDLEGNEFDANVLLDAKKELERALFDLKIQKERFNSEMVAKQKSIYNIIILFFVILI